MNFINFFQQNITPVYYILALHVVGICLLFVVGHSRQAGWLNTFIMAASFALAYWLLNNFISFGPLLSDGKQFYIDSFSIILLLLTTFVGTTTAFFSQRYMWHNVETGRISRTQLRLYHTMYQTFMLSMILAVVTNNIGILWVAMEGATLATVLLVSLYRTPEAVEAAWKYFILCIVGIALALFGIILVYFAATQVIADHGNAIFWSVLVQHATAINSTIMTIGFVFLLVGFGTKIGLVPLHNWLPDAHSESPAPMSTLLSGLLLNVALYALIRFKILADLSLQSHLAGNLMMGFGLLSFIVAAILLHRQSNIKRLFSYSSVEHMGLITFGFGIGGKLATFSALLYMLVHSLLKSAIFVNVGNIIQMAGTQSMDKIKGLIKQNPLLGWSLLITCLAISGLPPFGIFTSELMLLIATVKIFPIIAGVILLGMIIAFAGLLRNIQPLVYGETPDIRIKRENYTLSMTPAIFHALLALIMGVYLPPLLLHCLAQAGTLIVTNH